MEDKIVFSRKDVESSAWSKRTIDILDQYFEGLISEQDACAGILDTVYPAYQALDAKGVDREVGWVGNAIYQTRMDPPFGDEPARRSWSEHLATFERVLETSMQLSLQ